MTNLDIVLSSSNNVSAKELCVGDKIITMKNKNFTYTDVAEIEEDINNILYIKTTDSFVECSPDEFVYVRGKKIKASDVNIGDYIDACSGPARVKDVKNKGIGRVYNIRTNSSTLLANGILIGVS